jgi:hypothetical protein
MDHTMCLGHDPFQGADNAPLPNFTIRACLALIIQGAELSVSMTTLIPVPVSSTLRKPFCEALSRLPIPRHGV